MIDLEQHPEQPREPTVAVNEFEIGEQARHAGGANLSADMRNQSMGHIRAILQFSNRERVILRDADLSWVDREFAALRNTELTNTSGRGAVLGDATPSGVTVIGADFLGVDLVSTRLIAPIGLDVPRISTRRRTSTASCVSDACCPVASIAPSRGMQEGAV